MLIPNRKDNAVSGSEFANKNLNNKYSIIDNNALKEALDGNIPNFLRNFVSINIEENNNKLTYLVMPDVFSIGNDDDFIRMPISPLVAKPIADKYNCILPTKKMCDQIWKAATIKVSPISKGPPYDNSMLSMDTFIWHNKKIESQIIGKSRGEILSGHKKDIVIDHDLLNKKDRLGLYGWFNLNGTAIQGPTVNTSSHEVSYLDYASGIRFIAQDAMLNGNVVNMYDILLNKQTAYLISEQGPYNAKDIYK